MAERTEPPLLSEENCRAAAYYGVSVIQDYINDIREAAPPRTPEECGGPVYEYFLTHLNNLERILNGAILEDVIDGMKEGTNDAGQKDPIKRFENKSMQMAGGGPRKWYDFLRRKKK